MSYKRAGKGPNLWLVKWRLWVPLIIRVLVISYIPKLIY